VPEAYLSPIEKLAQNVYLSSPTTAQHAALAAFAPDTLAILDQRREELRARRDFLVPALRTLGFDIPQVPQGAFYVYAGCSRFTADSFAFARDLLEQAGVAVTPGIDFGSHGASGHVRFAYTNPIERLQEAVSRIERFLAG
jgi:aspartate/methionine/tyrosine aminotransferase